MTAHEASRFCGFETSNSTISRSPAEVLRGIRRSTFNFRSVAHTIQRLTSGSPTSRANRANSRLICRIRAPANRKPSIVM